MKGKLKSLTLLLVAALMVTLIAACSKNNEANNASNSAASSSASSAAPSEDSSKPLDPATLKVVLFGDKPVDMDKVLAEFENRTKDTLNTKLDMKFELAAEYQNKLNLMLTAGEEFDLAFDAPWWSMNQNISKDYYFELDKYFNNDEYPGLKAAFSPEFLESNKINGHIYAIPVTNALYDAETVLIRKDLREKYGLNPIQSFDDLKVYLQKVKENNPDMIPLASGRDTLYRMFTNLTDKQTTYRAYPYDIGGTGAQFNIVLSADGKQVLGATTIGDPDSDYANFPAPYNTPDFFYSHLDKRVDIRQFLPKDVLATATTAAGQRAGAVEKELTIVAKERFDLKQADPNWDWEIFVYHDGLRNMEEGAVGTAFKAWNFLVIPKTSKNIDRTMKYLDWLFTNPENHDLFELGIEGEHWTKDGDGKYRETANTKNYRFPGYEMTWNLGLSRVNGDNDAETLKYMDYLSKESSYYPLALRGFTFNSESVKTEIAKVQPKYDEYKTLVMAGVDSKWKENAVKWNKELRSLGLDTIRAELLKQVQAYLDAGGK